MKSYLRSGMLAVIMLLLVGLTPLAYAFGTSSFSQFDDTSSFSQFGGGSSFSQFDDSSSYSLFADSSSYSLFDDPSGYSNFDDTSDYSPFDPGTPSGGDSFYDNGFDTGGNTPTVPDGDIWAPPQPPLPPPQPPTPPAPVISLPDLTLYENLGGEKVRTWHDFEIDGNTYELDFIDTANNIIYVIDESSDSMLSATYDGDEGVDAWGTLAIGGVVHNFLVEDADTIAIDTEGNPLPSINLNDHVQNLDVTSMSWTVSEVDNVKVMIDSNSVAWFIPHYDFVGSDQLTFTISDGENSFSGQMVVFVIEKPVIPDVPDVPGDGNLAIEQVDLWVDDGRTWSYYEDLDDGSVVAVETGDDIELAVGLFNGLDVDLEDAWVTLYLYDDDNTYLVLHEDAGSIDAGDWEDAFFDFEIPEDLETGAYTLWLTARGFDENLNDYIDTFYLGLQVSSDHEEEEKGDDMGTFVSGIWIDKEYDLHPGDELRTSISFENDGDKELEDVKVTVFAPDLGIFRSVGPEDLHDGEDRSENLYMDIPEDAEPGVYYLMFTVTSANSASNRVLYREFEILP